MRNQKFGNAMLTSVLLFVAGGVIGLFYRVGIVLALSMCVAGLALAAWAIQGELNMIKVLILFAYLSALQGGYLAGLYIRYGSTDR